MAQYDLLESLLMLPVNQFTSFWNSVEKDYRNTVVVTMVNTKADRERKNAVGIYIIQLNEMITSTLIKELAQFMFDIYENEQAMSFTWAEQGCIDPELIRFNTCEYIISCERPEISQIQYGYARLDSAGNIEKLWSVDDFLSKFNSEKELLISECPDLKGSNAFWIAGLPETQVFVDRTFDRYVLATFSEKILKTTGVTL